ncbi:ester cyclase [Mycobacteroides franklinii]|uniref:Polyketide cyclase n=1 Tax=Mycobacteroides franklinii TaxID=948102 RepID=A0A4R5PCZ9_9MYCO|nr:ester cyclase [Mycobacteroides franklinii]ORA64581.1 polyketide cyclase [Mycobacteroides franklinii]TDH22693.1 polyketide cyclase [Mycobacteroides franklinii]TDZ44352.1 SnoaL-like polyketide cyclase [Mycobacteroides franklinii]TDZ51485.1 SnoaL-like polyketide cyclase [Mycobacteroides franklinii]TDZ57906.1 SnoaL-like polyketide cyclase [Mycobacteroides franklinii]
MESVRAEREKLVLAHFHDEVEQDWDAVLATFPHPRYELIPLGVVYDGRDEVRQYYIDTRIAFPDQRHEMIRLRHTDDAVVCEFYLLGTHKGPFGAVPATGSSFKVRMTAYFIFDGTTLVCERIYWDVLTMIKQLLGGLNFASPASYLVLAKALWGVRTLSSAVSGDEVHRIAD